MRTPQKFEKNLPLVLTFTQYYVKTSGRFKKKIVAFSKNMHFNISKIKNSQPIVFVKLYREHRQSVISDSTTASCITEVRGPSVNIESGVGSKQGNLLRGIVN